MAQGSRRGRGRTASGAAARPDRDAPEVGDKLYYRIGEVSRITGVKPYVLRYWESEFRWMAPAKSRSKQRLYRRRDIDTILLIKRLLYEERFTIAGARKRLRELGVAGAARSSGAEPGKGADAAPPAAGAAGRGRARAGAAPAGDEPPRDALRRIREELQAIRALL